MMTVTSPASPPLTAEVVSIGALLADHRLRIPEYQRPYTWTVENIGRLV